MKYKRYAIVAGVAFILCASGYYIAHAALVVSIDSDRLYRVVGVSDGDTFKVKVGLHVVAVRMLGVDTPETVDPRKPVQCYGAEASAETRRLLEGSRVMLELESDREERDKYGRYLAYVRTENGLLVNEHLIRNGYAKEYTFGKPYSRQVDFRRAEVLAQKEGRGLWSECD